MLIGLDRCVRLVVVFASGYPTQGVFYAIGHKPNTELFRGKVRKNDAGYILVQEPSTKTDLPGVFACGDAMDPIYRQATTQRFVFTENIRDRHARRARIAALGGSPAWFAERAPFDLEVGDDFLIGLDRRVRLVVVFSLSGVFLLLEPALSVPVNPEGSWIGSDGEPVLPCPCGECAPAQPNSATAAPVAHAPTKKEVLKS